MKTAVGNLQSVKSTLYIFNMKEFYLFIIIKGWETVQNYYNNLEDVEVLNPKHMVRFPTPNPLEC